VGIFSQHYKTLGDVPPFSEITHDDYREDINTGIEQHKLEVEFITSNPEKATFQNTIVALEKSGAILRRLTHVMFNLSYCHTSDELQQLVQSVAPNLSAHNDSIYMNDQLWKRVKQLWDDRNDSEIDEQDTKLLELYYKQFVNSGALLTHVEKERVATINQRLSILSLQFSQNLLQATNDYVLIIEDQNRLSGLPQNIINEAAKVAEEKGHLGSWLFTLHNASVIPFLTYADDRQLREEIWQAMVTKCDHDELGGNRPLVRETIELRHEKAKILGFESHAAYVLKDRMAKEPSQVMDLLSQLWDKAKQPTNAEYDKLLVYMHNHGVDGDLKAFDWRYYAEKVRKEQYDLDEEMLKPYFSLANVVKGVMDVATKLYGVRFQINDNYPKYHEDVVTYDVIDDQGQNFGILMMDYFQRASKIGGAWMTSYKEQEIEGSKRILPIISIVCNYSKASDELPTLLTFDEVNTLFHEFGHALHGLLSDVRYTSLAGTNVPTDFVELPSQILENWATDPIVMRQYAKHYLTGESIPDHLLEKLESTKVFGQGFAITEYLAASILDMHFHTYNPSDWISIEQFENRLWEDIGLHPAIVSRYRSTYFSHIFAGGYSAGYYSYIWSEVLDADAFDLFVDKGIFDHETANAFRETILSKGGSSDADELYRRFRGRDPKIEGLLKKRGLV
jgi:peptidyl-dipeptidase Dcp